MKYIPFNDNFIEVDEERKYARFLIKSELQAELDRADYNIQELNKMIEEAQAKVAPTTKLDQKQVQAITEYNKTLGIENYQFQLQQFTDQKKQLETILK